MSSLEQRIITAALSRRITTREQFDDLKREFSKRAATSMPSNPRLQAAFLDLIAQGKARPNPALMRILQKRAMRSQSGIAAITVSTKPGGCGSACVYCPTKGGMPKSYIATEPAIMRAVRNAWDPARQTKARIKALEATGHLAQKIELRVLGGTFSFYPKKYQEWFIKRCFDAANGKTSRTLEQAKKMNEKAEYRFVGISLETRPDCITPTEVPWFRYLGATIIEIGVQTVYDDIQKITQRGHTLESVRRATALLRDAGFKMQYHIMPELPGSSPAKDIAIMDELFSNPAYQPDMLKIYPCLVIKDAELYDWWKMGKYKPYDDKTRRHVLKEMKKRCPPYVRITRLIRDVPSTEIAGGNMVTNLREELQRELIAEGTPCRCIRCREPKADVSGVKRAKLFTQSYDAADGKEYFLSMETPDQKTLFSFLRLRLPGLQSENQNGKSKIQIASPQSLAYKVKWMQKKLGIADCALIRELHTYGVQLGIGTKSKDSIQHRGFGKRLMAEAEKIAKKGGFKKMAVISGVGVREYYRKLGYRKKNEYMLKNL